MAGKITVVLAVCLCGVLAVVQSVPYTKPTDIPDTIPRSCADRPPANDYLMVPSPQTCSKFIVCDGDRETVFDCPDGLHFCYAKQYCDFPENSDCTDPTTVRSTTI
ncbi:putative chitinase 10, partial [Frankliniella fusca]